MRSKYLACAHLNEIALYSLLFSSTTRFLSIISIFIFPWPGLDRGMLAMDMDGDHAKGLKPRRKIAKLGKKFLRSGHIKARSRVRIFLLARNGISAAISVAVISILQGTRMERSSLRRTFQRASWLCMWGTSKKSRCGVWSPSYTSITRSSTICSRKPSRPMASTRKESSEYLARFLI